MPLQYNPNQMSEINRTGISSNAGILSNAGISSNAGILSNAGGAMMMIPGLQVAGAATAIAGLGLSAYGQYKSQQTARKNYEMKLREFDYWKKRKEEMDIYNKQQTQLANTMSYGKYASGVKQNSISNYGRYNKSIGR